MSPPDFKHRPFAALSNVVVKPAAAPPARGAPPAPAARGSLARVVVREEFDTTENAVITRVIGLPLDQLDRLGKRWREVLGKPVLIEGREVLVMTDDGEQVAELVRRAGSSEVAVVRRAAPVEPAPRAEARVGPRAAPGEAGGTQRAQIRRGLRVAIVLKADQGTGALTEGVVQDILTSSPTHPRGIKVRLESGQVGRVQRLLAR